MTHMLASLARGKLVVALEVRLRKFSLQLGRRRLTEIAIREVII
jgi:hypothetical protein